VSWVSLQVSSLRLITVVQSANSQCVPQPTLPISLSWWYIIAFVAVGIASLIFVVLIHVVLVHNCLLVLRGTLRSFVRCSGPSWSPSGSSLVLSGSSLASRGHCGSLQFFFGSRRLSIGCVGLLRVLPGVPLWVLCGVLLVLHWFFPVLHVFVGSLWVFRGVLLWVLLWVLGGDLALLHKAPTGLLASTPLSSIAQACSQSTYRSSSVDAPFKHCASMFTKHLQIF
jgi:hypothetical protein